MMIGAMNHPQRDPVEEMDWMGRLGLDFIDLTLEPPAAASWKMDPAVLKEGLERNRLKAVGHTAFYLPIVSPIDDLRAAAMQEMRRCIDLFAAIGVLWVNVHPDPHMHFHTETEMREQNRESLRELLEHAAHRGTGLMVENIPKRFNSVEQLAPLLDPLPDLGLHLDIGHANLEVKENTTAELVAHYGPRIRHVHLHDNKGGSADLHLPLGAGTIDMLHELGELKSSGYDGTITLEVFSKDTHYFAYSRDVLRALWDTL
jgi:sugar phosphate isomerase/epimerase